MLDAVMFGNFQCKLSIRHGQEHSVKHHYIAHSFLLVDTM